jgi:pyruvate dehydrogenase E2 component (dihydrolipoamide acetyltransferase)
MAYEFKLPDIGEGVVEGEIVRWLVKEGEDVRADQPMVEVMTDKATVEIPAPRAGRIIKRMFVEGQICPVGKVLVAIEESGGGARPPAPAPARSPGSGPVPRPREEEETMRLADQPARAPAPSLPAPAAGAGPVLATPATRKLARTMEVDLASVPGSGPGGRITSDDVRAYVKRGTLNGSPYPAAAAGRGPAPSLRAPSGPPQPDVRIPFRGLRRKIAEHLVHSKHEAAHFTYVEEVDCTELVALREKANARLAAAGVKLSFLPYIIKATVDALRQFPQLNATLDVAASEIVQRRQYHIGLATATPEGLIVPVVRDADRKSILDLARDIERLGGLTRAGKASREDLSGSTFTITSLGALGGVLATPIINHPEVAILGVHKITKRPAVRDDKIVARDLMNLSISVDHRLVDGYEAARFVAHIKESLESPGLLFLDSI